jgi:limonene-1,2-epoxide hydrolase
MQRNTTTRRHALTTAGWGAAAMAGLAGRAQAAERTATEKINVQVVNDFCAAWPSHDVAKIMSFFADPCSYRMTETREPVKGHEAVTGAIKGIVGLVESFEVLDTYAKGSMVVNERIDHFTGGKMKSWHGVGVFFLKDGKIVEWSDYGIPA